jgi:hypothetical protein
MIGDFIHPLPIRGPANITFKAIYIQAVKDELMHRTWIKYKQFDNLSPLSFWLSVHGRDPGFGILNRRKAEAKGGRRGRRES